MSVAKGESLGVKVLQALGFSAEDVTDARLIMAAGEPARLVVTYYVRDEGAVERTVREFRLAAREVRGE